MTRLSDDRMIRDEGEELYALPCSPPEGERERASIAPRVPWGEHFSGKNYFLNLPPTALRFALRRLPLRGGVRLCHITHHVPPATPHEVRP
jgi:hypothetical protein